MAIKDVFKVNRKTFFDPRTWLGYDFVKENTRTLWGAFRDVFSPAKIAPLQGETFEEAVKRLALSEPTIHEIGQTYCGYAIFFLVLAIGVAAFSLYLLVDGYLLDFFIGLAVTSLLLSQAFKNHFWYFQIKHRKLGCTFAEWRRGTIKQ
jgi:intracellular multiplication protein IcmV